MKVTFPVKNNISKEFSENCVVKKLERKKLRRKQRNKLGGTFIMFLFFCFIIPKVFFNTFDYLFVRPVLNSVIQIPKDYSLLSSTEKYFANDYFLDGKFLGNVETQHPLMKSMVNTGKMPVLTNRLKNLAGKYPYLTPGVFIWDFSTGKSVGINDEKEFSTASMIKLPVLVQLFRRAELGSIRLNGSMVLNASDVSGGSGFLQYRPVGSVLSIMNLAQLMIQESDNTATNMLLSSIGGINDLNRVLRSWGFSKTHMSDLLPDLYGTNVSTPKDLGTILYNIDNPSFLSLESRANIVQIMSHVKNRFLIQAGLPDSAQFIHKSGDIGEMLGDAGIVMLPDGRKYIIVIMVKRPWNSFSAKEFIIEASKITYNSIASGDY
jgi:beta-lactamase class A